MFFSKRFSNKFGHIFYVNFKERGKWIRLSTGQKTKRAAQQWYSDNFKDIKTCRLTRFSETIIPLLTKERLPGTIRIYKSALKNLIKFTGDIRVSEVTFELMQRYKNQRDLSAAALNIEIRAFKFLFRMAEDLGYGSFKLGKVKQVPTFESDIIVIPPDHLQEIFNNAFNNTLRAGFFLALNVGLRLSEINNLEWTDINYNKRIAILTKKGLFVPKNKKKNVAYLSDHVLNYLNQLPKEGSYILNKDGKPLRKEYLTKGFAKAVYISKLPREYHFHCLRHTYITNLVNAGVHPFDVCKLARHSNISMTMKYYHPADDKLLTELSKAPRLLKAV